MRLRTWLLVVVVLSLLGGCTGGSPGYPVYVVSIVEGTVDYTGPLPTLGDYGGDWPLTPQLYLGLFAPGSRLPAYSQPVMTQILYDPLVQPPYQFHWETPKELLPFGTYQSALFTPMAWYDTGLGMAFQEAAILQRGPTVTISQPAPAITTFDISLNLTGQPPYGSISGRAMVCGNPPMDTLVEITLKPGQPVPGLGANATLVQVPPHLSDLGWMTYTVPDLAYGTYTVSYAGFSLRDRDDAFHVSSRQVALSDATPEIAGIDFLVNTSWQSQRPYDRGVIRGTLHVTGAAATSVVVVSAGPDPSVTVLPPYDQSSPLRHAHWFVLPAELASGEAPFQLGWLEDGLYEITVHELSGAVGSEKLRLTLPKAAELTAEQREATGLVLEVTLP